MARTNRPRPGQLVFGLFLITVGLFWTLDAMRLIDANDFWHYWPALLIVYGISQLMSPPAADGSRHGMFMVLAGFWLLGNTIGLLWWETSWPLLVIALGLSIVWKALAERETRALPTPTENDHGR